MGFFSRKKTSKTVAKDRLKLVLIHDRVNCSTDVLEMMRADILQTISKYMDFDEGELELKVGSTRSDTSGNVVPALYANIPITNIKKPKG
jgi:cell division topological specificity factor